VPTGKVRVKTVVDTFEQVVQESLKTERAETTRLEIGKEIDTIPPVRTHGDTTIIPIVEEVLVVEKRLILKEAMSGAWSRTTKLRCQSRYANKELSWNAMTRIMTEGRTN
jgi:hypothetical protein